MNRSIDRKKAGGRQHRRPHTSEQGCGALFGRPNVLIGMVHLSALPGTPRAKLSLDSVVDIAVRDALLLCKEGFDAVIIENMFDVPYLRRGVGPEIVAGMTRCGLAVREAVGAGYPIGVQVLAGANEASLAIAQAIDARFIRAEGFVFASVADEGLMDQADAGPLLRYRKMIGAEHVAVLVDIDKKHSAHAITADVSLADKARAAAFFGADGLILTGIRTGQATDINDLRVVRDEAATGLPLIAGSGATPDTLADLWAVADAVIIGSWLKQDGRWDRPVDRHRVHQVARSADRIRRSRPVNRGK